MSEELGEVDFQRFWRRLQQLGLNAYESRSYLVLLGHPKFKALELAARSHVPRQKIYEVLDSLVEKGFAQVVQEKTKLFSAVEPSLAIPEIGPLVPTRPDRKSTRSSIAWWKRVLPRWCRRRRSSFPRSSPVWRFPDTWGVSVRSWNRI